MSNITNLKILIVGLTTVLALNNFAKDRFRKEVLGYCDMYTDVMSNQNINITNV
ncbi:hypothetical protein SAMN04487979_1294 [Flavobacterium sp. ov086]|nr:hypothetical protein SAMN04487979_1294 [Flavobacterium sp. ov086]